MGKNQHVVPHGKNWVVRGVGNQIFYFGWQKMILHRHTYLERVIEHITKFNKKGQSQWVKINT